MSKPSSYLQASQSRWNDHSALIRKEIDMMLDGIEIKSHFLESLRSRVGRHRQEDADQLRSARAESWDQWDQRLKRVEEWMVEGASLYNVSSRVKAWQSSIHWFNRGQQILERYTARLDKAVVPLERALVTLGEKVNQWSDRLVLKEADLRLFMEREAIKGMEVLVSAARKQPYLDFVYAEREEEARLAREFKMIRGAANHALERFSRAEKWSSEKALVNPAHFEISKNNILMIGQLTRARLLQIREGTLTYALSFEEGRRRLRWIYDSVQHMRVVHGTLPKKQSLLQRVFKIQDN